MENFYLEIINRKKLINNKTYVINNFNMKYL